MAQPIITVTVEPFVDGKARYLRCAPEAGQGGDNGLLNIALNIRNDDSKGITITDVKVKVVGAAAGEVDFPMSQAIGVNRSSWIPLSKEILFLPRRTLSLRVRVYEAVASEPLDFVLPLDKHSSPGGANRFWANVRDLRPTEFWKVDGLHHSRDNYAQVHAYDVGMRGGDGAERSELLPGGSWSVREDYRIWGKPIHAIAEGVVQHFRNDFPLNSKANADPTPAEQAYIDTFPDGNGNFFTIAGGGETVLYAHMIPGSLNPELLRRGARVAQGEYLGQVGNSGQASGPHLHIHSNKTVGGAISWVGAPRPLPWFGARAVAWDQLGAVKSAAPWATLAGRGVPTGECAIWPSDSPVVDLREAPLRQFTISGAGQVWVVKKGDNKVRYASQALPPFGYVGAYLDQNPGGLAKQVAVHGSQPYLIGTDDKVWEGKPNGWVVLPGSPSVKRIATDASTGVLWCITSTNAIKSFTPGTRAWQTHPGGGKGRDICAHDGVPYVIGTNSGIYQSRGGDGWRLLPGGGKGKRVGVDTNTGKLWVIGMNDGIYAYHGASGWNEHAHNGRARELFVHDGKPFIIGKTGNALWRSAGAAGWHRMNVIEPF